MSRTREREGTAGDRTKTTFDADDARDLLFSLSPVPLWVWDVETRCFVGVNDAALRLYGYTRQELEGAPIETIVAPDARESMRSKPGPAFGTLDWSGEGRHVTKDGRVLHVELGARSVEMGGRRLVFAVAHDVTERREQRERAFLAQKDDAVASLAARVVHDFNNLLAGILTTAEYIAEELGDDHALNVEARDIATAAQRAAEFTRQLLALAKGKMPSDAPGALRVVLVVEDDDNVRRVIARVLARRGYEVVVARHGEDALAEMQKRPRVHLLLTDVSMPGMDGPTLAKHVRAKHPEVPILFMCGDSDDAHAELERLGGALLRKPFAAENLCAAVLDACADQ